MALAFEFEVQTSVDQGEAMLDERLPNRWFRLIDLDTLNLDRGDCCILGQLNKHIDGVDAYACNKNLRYNSALKKMGLTFGDAEQMGFAAPRSILNDDEYNGTTLSLYYAELTEEWKRRIQARLVQ